MITTMTTTTTDATMLLIRTLLDFDFLLWSDFKSVTLIADDPIGLLVSCVTSDLKLSVGCVLEVSNELVADGVRVVFVSSNMDVGSDKLTVVGEEDIIVFRKEARTSSQQFNFVF